MLIFSPSMKKERRDPRIPPSASLSQGLASRFSWSLVPRSIALFIILYQFRLLAADLADTAVFALSLSGAFAAALFLVRRAKPGEALLIITLIPWTIRSLIALPRFFTGGTALVLDSLLLNLDRNNFVLLGPFYWAAVTTYFSARSRVFLRGDIIAADTLFLVLFSIAPSAGMTAYRWPVLMIALFGGVFYLQVLALILSIPPELGLRRKEGIAAAMGFLFLVVTGGALLVRPSQEKAAERGGGLLEPRLFHFDFSQVLRLDSEFSLNDDLMLIVKKDGKDDHILTRRYTLSGFNLKQGFFRMEGPDEAAHPQRLPDRQTVLKTRPIREYRETSQEYYLVNFDASAFIGMNMPVEIFPFKTWDASSFKSAYGVLSHTSGAAAFDLMDAVRGTPGYGGISPEDLGLSADEYRLYTEYGGDREIEEYAEQICWGIRGYWDRIEAVLRHLRDGEYRYSLKPGIAPQGDQLKYFLFETKKGYCSYYAYAFALLLRSMGVPCRIAAGFFIDPDAGVFDYYPVRADMAHTWVEVWYPGYGWIDYDPTTEKEAEGEDFRFSPGTPPELFERLLKEILDNRHRLTPGEGAGEDRKGLNLAALGTEAFRLLKKRGLPLALILLALVFGWMRAGALAASVLARRKRKKAGFLWAHVLRRLALGGRRRGGSAEADWAKDQERLFPGLYDLYLGVSAARFAERYGEEDWRSYKNGYRRFDRVYRGAVPLKRRILAWLLPPLALFLGPGGRGKKTGTALLLLAFLLLGRDGGAQNGVPPADRFLEDAQAAQEAEFWDRAVEL
jgi:transglutaminase-like putative cysteine protease